MTIRPKRRYPLPAHLRRRPVPPLSRFGWRGVYRFMGLCILFAAPQSVSLWRITRGADPFTFGLLSVAYTILFGIFLMIARPWERRPE